MSKYCFSEKQNASKNGESRKTRGEGAKAPPAAPHSACVVCVCVLYECVSVSVHASVSSSVRVSVCSRDKTLLHFFFFFSLNKKGKHVNLVRFLKRETASGGRSGRKKPRPQMYILALKLQGVGGELFHFTLKSQWQLPVCLLAPTFPMYMIQNGSFSPRNHQNSVGFCRIQASAETRARD